MLRTLRNAVLAVIFAALGAAAGRIAADLRRQIAAGQEPRIDLDRIDVRGRDVVPGLVAAMRVRSGPWSYLHVPAWLAAFTVNFVLAAFAGELGLGSGENDDGEITTEEPAPAETGDGFTPFAP